MNDSSIDLPDNADDLSRGYEPFDGKSFKAVEHVDSDGMAAATGFISTAEDMAKFLRWQLSVRETPKGISKVLSADTLREMQRPVRMTESWQAGQGLGFWIQTASDRRLVGHGGQMPGFFSHSAIDPENNIGVALLANGMRVPVKPGEAGSIIDAIFKTVATAIEDTEHKVAEASWRQCFGVYRSMWGTLQVLELDGELVAFDPEGPDPFSTMYTLTRDEELGAHGFRATKASDSFYLGEAFHFEEFEGGRPKVLRDPGAQFVRVDDSGGN